MQRNQIRVALPLLASLVLACSAADSDSTEYDGAGGEHGGDPDGRGEEGGAAEGGAAEGGDSEPSDGDHADSAGDDGVGGTGDEETGGSSIEPGQLTAAEWRDLDHWAFWRGLFENGPWAQQEAQWEFFTTQRFAVVVAADELPIVDAEVTLLDADQSVVWAARTDNLGRAELFADLFDDTSEGPYSVVATNGTQSQTVAEVTPGEPVSVKLPAGAPRDQIDLMFMVDTTGSMGDELEYLQVELRDVIEQVESNVGEQLDLRLSVNFYRDHGDAYLVRSFPFTADVDEALSNLKMQRADGGGDYPEAVEVALDDAIAGHEWRDEARARLLFFVLDAPPHHNAKSVASMQDSVREAARLGVRIVPLAASGVDKDTEFLLRFLAISTGSTYTFLTDDSGIGGSHLEPTVGDYQVELLNDLLVRLISGAVQ